MVPTPPAAPVKTMRRDLSKASVMLSFLPRALRARYGGGGAIYSREMSPPATAVPDRPIRWGLAAKVFAVLILLGAVAVLVTGILGYVRARDVLEETIFNQLTAARQTKARQVETYFRTIRHDLRL